MLADNDANEYKKYDYNDKNALSKTIDSDIKRESSLKLELEDIISIPDVDNKVIKNSNNSKDNLKHLINCEISDNSNSSNTSHIEKDVVSDSNTNSNFKTKDNQIRLDQKIGILTRLTSFGKDKVLEDLKERLKTRKNSKVSVKEIFLLDYCSCCFTLTNKDILIQDVREYIENCFEVAHVVSYRREIDFIKSLILLDNQRRMYILPSLNTEFENNVNLEVDYEKDDHQDLHFDVELVEHLVDIDLDNFTSKKLVANMVESII